MTKRFLLALILCLLWFAAPAHAAITYVGGCAAQTTSCTFDVAPSSGDAIIVFAHKDGATTLPTIPTTTLSSPTATVSNYAKLKSSTSTSNSAITAVRISDGTETTTGTWTGATSIAALIYRGANVSPFGNFASGGAVSTSIAYNTFTLDKTNTTSWVVGCSAHRTATNNTTAPTGMTARKSATDIICSDTNGAVASWSTTSVTVNASSGWNSIAIELLAQTGEDTTKLYVDDYIAMNTADADPTTLSGTVVSGGVLGPDTTGWNCYDDNTSTVGTTVDFFESATQWSAPATIRVRSTSTDYAVGSTSKTLRFKHNTTNFHSCRLEGIASTLHRGAVTVASWMLLAPSNAGASGNLFDYIRVQTADGNFCVFQLNNGDGGTGYHVRIESNPAGVTRQGSNITPTPNTRYWVVVQCNFQAQKGTLRLYDTTGTQVGSDVTGSLQYTPTDMANGAYVDAIWIGNAETQTDASTTIWQHILFDYSAAAFPLGPNVTGGGGGATLHMHLLMGVGQ